jgi:glycosyltransferase involved in cell wall biosynthesis
VRIWLVCNAPLNPDSGAPGRKFRLGQELAARGHEVQTFGHEQLSPRWGRAGKHLFALEVARRLRRAGAPEVADVSGAEGWVALLLGGRRRPAMVVRSHGIEHRFWAAYRRELGKGYPPELIVPRLGLLHRALRLPQVRLSIRRCDHLICLSGQEREYVLARRWIEPGRVSVINNAVDDAFYAEHDYARRTQNVLYVNSWIFMKGVRYFAGAMNRLMAERPAVRLSLAGTGAVPVEFILGMFRPELRDRIRVLPLVPHEQMVREYLAADVLVMPSLIEPYGNVLAEAMAAGLACVATPFGAAGDLGRDGENMLIVPPADPAAIAAKVAFLLDRPEERARLGRAARQAAEGLRWKLVVPKTEEAYALALESAARRAGR